MKRVIVSSKKPSSSKKISATSIMAHGVAEVISEYDPGHVDYMHQLYIELFKELIKHFSDEAYTPLISDIKESWKEEAIADGMMTEEDFEVLYKALLDETNDLVGRDY